MKPRKTKNEKNAKSILLSVFATAGYLKETVSLFCSRSNIWVLPVSFWLSTYPSVCATRVLNAKKKRRRKTKIGM